jgi:hypothetical protein
MYTGIAKQSTGVLPLEEVVSPNWTQNTRGFMPRRKDGKCGRPLTIWLTPEREDWLRRKHPRRKIGRALVLELEGLRTGRVKAPEPPPGEADARERERPLITSPALCERCARIGLACCSTCLKAEEVHQRLHER